MKLIVNWEKFYKADISKSDETNTEMMLRNLTYWSIFKFDGY